MADWSKEDFEEFDEEKKSNSNNNENPVQWMKFNKSGKYKVRLIGKYVKYNQFWKPFGHSVIVSDEDRNSVSPTKAGFYPSTKFAILVIDKTGLEEGEVGEVKVLDKGPSVFKNFHEYYVNNEINPAGKDGPDFVISVKNAGTLNAEYSVTPIVKPAPITKEEVAKIKEVKENWPALDVLKKAKSAEEIEALWDALPDEKKIKEEPSKNERISTETTAATTVDAAIEAMDDEDDPF